MSLIFLISLSLGEARDKIPFPYSRKTSLLLVTQILPNTMVKLCAKAWRYLAGLFPLTLQGTITLLFTSWALSAYGYGAMDLVVFALAICGLSILVCCLFCSVGFGIFMQRKIRREIANSDTPLNNIEVEAGYPNETGFSLPAVSFFPLVRLAWKIIYPDEIATRTRLDSENQLREEIIPSRRCLSERVVREFSVRDVLGLSQFSWRLEQAVSCKALPQVSAVKQLPILRSLTAEDGIPHNTGDPEGDRMEIRPYAPGDSVKNIMWKVYARNRQLNVRLPERSVFQSKRTLAYLLTSKHDEAAAAVARVALETGALGEDWAFGADGFESPVSDLSSALQAIAGSRSLDGGHDYGLDRFLGHAGNHGSAHCIVFAAAEKNPSLELLKNTISSYSCQFSLIMATDSLQEEQNPAWWKKYLLRRDSNAQPLSHSTRHDLLHLLTEVGQQVESTLVVDRETGFSFDQYLRKV